jgi:hypothetical protein
MTDGQVNLGLQRAALADRKRGATMSPSEMRARTAAELERVPRGGLDQNVYRAALQNCLMNSMGVRSRISSVAAAHAAALQLVRQSSPDFEPTISSS